MADTSLIPVADRALARQLRGYLARHHLDRAPNGQCRFGKLDLFWSPTDPDDWHAGGPGDLCPRLDDRGNGGILFARLARLGPVTVHAAPGEPLAIDFGGDAYSGATLGHACAAALVAKE